MSDDRFSSVLLRLTALETVARRPRSEVRAISGARVYNSAAISIASGVNAAITFDSERYDDASYHSTSVNTSRLTIPLAGRYLIGAHIAFAAHVTGARYLQLRLNNGTFLALQATQALTGGAVTYLSLATAYNLAAGDYIEVFPFQDSGVALDVTSAGAYTPEFWIETL